MVSTLTKLTAVVRNATAKHTATVIFMHGFGDSGAGWAPVGEQLGKYAPHVKFIFPNAPALPITANGGMLTPAWYDIKSLSAIERTEDEEGLLRSRQQVMELIREEVDRNNIPADRIVLGGFSQGCVLSLFTALTSEYRFAGVTALSGYLPLHTKIMAMVSDANRKTPIFWGHGDSDQVVKYKYGEQSVGFLKENKYSIRFHTYPRMGHSACPQELRDLLSFFQEVIPEELPVKAKA
ncbi:hypothetical protein BGW39_011159 [Mortierella sp. 14UC]|nr:hypothetical protein BGW39_011159 [Mortierella sp. 14UC]